MSLPDRIDDVRLLEARLYEYLRIPAAGLDHEVAEWWEAQSALSRRNPPGHPGLERLRHAVSELKQDAARIGTVPPGYPRHINLIMRAISALLPWYTRNLAQFGQRASHTVELLADVLEETLRMQHSFQETPARRQKKGVRTTGMPAQRSDHEAHS